MSPSLSQALLLRKSDQALCAAVRDGHEAAFAAIVLRYRSQLLRHCRSLLRDGHAEDGVQQTFVRALQALRSGTEVHELGPWLHRIARNVALSELGAPGHGHAELSEQWEDHRRAGEFDRRADLREALLAVQALPDRQRAALARSVAGEKPAVIAEQLGLTNAALRQLLHRARASVRAAVNVICPPPVLWLSRRMAAVCDRFPRTAGIPAGAAPVASKIAIVVVASASVAGPATVIHSVLSHPDRLARAPRQVASRAARARAAVQPLIAAIAAVPPPPPASSGPVAHLVPLPAAAPASPHPWLRPGQPPGISGSSPTSAPVGEASGAGAASSSTAIAADVSASSTAGATSGDAGPVATATASGPTATSTASSTAPASTSPTDSSSTSATATDSSTTPSSSTGAAATDGSSPSTGP